MSAHTPGPWHVEDGYYVATEEWEICWMGAIEGGMTSEEMTANSRLIAAAPDLYAYAARMAATGDTEAKMLLQKINGEQA